MPYRRISDPQRLQSMLEAVLLIESDLHLEVLLRRIVEVACDLVGAEYGALGVLDSKERRIVQFVTVGISDTVAAQIGHYPTGQGILGLLIDQPEPIRLEELSAHPVSVGFPPRHPPMHSFIGVPIRIRDEIYGDIYLAEKFGEGGFTELDLDVVETLAIAAGIAIANARLHSKVNELSVAADRERIARDLHDTVIQRLYGIGLSIQGSLRLVEDASLNERLRLALDEIDTTIVQVRTTIFELEDRTPVEEGLRARVLALINESGRVLRFDPEVRFSGPLDAAVPSELAGHVLAVLRETLSNVARHAQARHVEVVLRIEGGQLEVVVNDDGIGFKPRDSRVGNGVTNIGQRAESLGGSCLIGDRPGGGTEVRWRVPIRP